MSPTPWHTRPRILLLGLLQHGSQQREKMTPFNNYSSFEFATCQALYVMPLNSHASPQVGILIARLQMKPLRFRDVYELVSEIREAGNPGPQSPSPSSQSSQGVI